MKRNFLLPIIGAGIVSALLAPLAGAADEELPDHKLKEWSLGEHLSGPEVKMDDLDGKVVVIEYWGTR